VPRILLGCAALALFALPCRAGETSSTSETLIRLSVPPAPAPRPALRYLLLPELGEMNPGNPIPNYMKCFMEQQKYLFDKEAFQRRGDLLGKPLSELPAQEVQDLDRSALSQADWAARLDKPDWQILLRLKTDGVSLLLPDVQQVRTLAKALQGRFRSEVAQGRLDDAIRTAKTLLAMSRHLSEHPTFIGDLVGIAIAYMTLGPLEEMLEQPGCPNLYWALTSLPNPFVPLDKGWDGERVTVMAEFRDLDEGAPMSADQIKKFVAHMEMVIGVGNPIETGKRVRSWLDARTKDEGMVRAARRRLVEGGLSEERLLRFPADQVILLDEKREYEVRRDDVMKLMNLPAWQAEALAARYKLNKEPTLFAEALVGGTYNVRRAQARLDQRIALLRHVEALRLYAAENDGILPVKLSDVPVPLPDDPFTGKPFRYEVDGKTAHLRGSPPKGEEKEAVFNVHYEVTIQR
jgi:hypothetical protein